MYPVLGRGVQRSFIDSDAVAVNRLVVTQMSPPSRSDDVKQQRKKKEKEKAWRGENEQYAKFGK